MNYIVDASRALARLGEWADADPETTRKEMLRVHRALVILSFIETHSPRADETCAEPGITIMEGAVRHLRDQNHPLFVDSSDD